jgi:heparan-alpha-glucosaminide N-acetyltransferase
VTRPTDTDPVEQRVPDLPADEREPLTTPSGRLRSLDVARGTVVGLSAVLSHIPGPGYEWARHPQWYGLTLLDFILPGFLLLFGSGIAIAYRKGIRWQRLARRTVLLVGIGLLFNAIVAWDFGLETWRVTGVLQLFAAVGLIVTAVTRILTRWWQAAGLAAVVLGGHQWFLLASSARCPGGLPQPECNPSGRIDPAVFGADHVYRGAAAGHDPDGFVVLIGVTATVLIGYAAGRLLWERRHGGAVLPLLALGGACLAAAPLLGLALPVNKRLWTPSYALVTAAATVILLVLMHVLVDRLPARRPATAAAVLRASWLAEAFGRNSLLVYFGKYLVAAVLANVALGTLTGGEPIAPAYLGWLETWSPNPPLTFMVTMLAAWALIAAVLHARGRYLRV